MTTLSDYVERGFPTGLMQALAVTWPDRASAEAYADHTLVPTIKRMGWHPFRATLDMPDCSPTEAFLTSIAFGQRRDRTKPVYEALDFAIGRKLQQKTGVLMLDAVDRWAAPEWQDDVSAYRAWFQMRYGHFFVVYNLTDRRAVNFLFLRKDQPLYGQGLRLRVDMGGNIV